MRHLCDSNVLIAVLLEDHPHHVPVRRWVSSLDHNDRITLCRATQTTLLRLLTTEAVMGEDTHTNAQAVGVVESLMGHSRSELVVREPPDLQRVWFGLAGPDQASPKLWMDAYLAAFAIGFSLRLVTFDREFERFRDDGLDLLLLDPR